eukprot:CAMPEP_0181429884 /NCGR_PEP_ID=MMETSP1110-20121109/17436_1 /TAXON_ID=174948 /ORGANISM="Symbiodinium sp., Strain CCMP421" /LENGTH=460 /DNA_ID=CAMNT_0023553179 /DNA_START=631 /DNA_END=2014 /DNA_ORIENTATION=-
MSHCQGDVMAATPSRTMGTTFLTAVGQIRRHTQHSPELNAPRPLGFQPRVLKSDGVGSTPSLALTRARGVRGARGARGAAAAAPSPALAAPPEPEGVPESADSNEADSSPVEVSPTQLQEAEDDANLSDDEAEEELTWPSQPTFVPGKIKVMQRQQAGEEIPKSSDESDSGRVDPSRLPLEERERYYMEARARIFGENAKVEQEAAPAEDLGCEDPQSIQRRATLEMKLAQERINDLKDPAYSRAIYPRFGYAMKGKGRGQMQGFIASFQAAPTDYRGMADVSQAPLAARAAVLEGNQAQSSNWRQSQQPQQPQQQQTQQQQPQQQQSQQQQQAMQQQALQQQAMQQQAMQQQAMQQQALQQQAMQQQVMQQAMQQQAMQQAMQQLLLQQQSMQQQSMQQQSMPRPMQQQGTQNSMQQDVQGGPRSQQRQQPEMRGMVVPVALYPPQEVNDGMAHPRIAL